MRNRYREHAAVYHYVRKIEGSGGGGGGERGRGRGGRRSGRREEGGEEGSERERSAGKGRRERGYGCKVLSNLGVRLNGMRFLLLLLLPSLSPFLLSSTIFPFLPLLFLHSIYLFIYLFVSTPLSLCRRCIQSLSGREKELRN